MRAISTLLLISFLLTGLPVYSQATDCAKIKFTPQSQSKIEVPVTIGNTNNDSTFENIQPFVDIEIPYIQNTNILSTCSHKNNSARILNINKDGNLTLVESTASADPVSSNDPAATRGICALNSIGSQLFFPGIGPKESGFDRIYPYNIDSSLPLMLNRTQEDNTNNFFIPSDLTCSVTVTPNDKYLVYLQANTSKGNLASLQSVEIKSNMALGESFVGQDLAKIIKAGNYLEFAKNPSYAKSKFTYGVFSNLEQGKGGSSDGFAIFKTNQENGVNTIIGEFKKDNPDFPLPEIFNTPVFSGFSGFKIVQRDTGIFLLVSYFENNINFGLPNFSYITKLALFKVNIESSLNKESLLSLIGKPLVTVFQTSPCNINNFHGIAGPITIVDDFAYVADNNTEGFSKNENYIAAYFIKWSLIDNAKENTQIIKLASIPVRTSKTNGERNTDIVVTSKNKSAHIAVLHSKQTENTKLYGFSLTQLPIQCSELKDDLNKNGLCSLNIPEEKLAVDSVESVEKATPTPLAILPIPALPSSTPQSSRGRPPEFNAPSSNQITSTTAQKTTLKIPKNLNPSEIGQPNLPSPTTNFAPIELIPSDSIANKTATQDINLSSLNFKGPDQIIISPRIPFILINTGNLESAKLVKITEEFTQLKEKLKDKTILTTLSKEEAIVYEQKPIQECCSCETGKLICKDNALPSCENGIISCSGADKKTISCCKGSPPSEVCKSDDPTISCFAQTVQKQENKKDSQDLSTPILTLETRGAIKAGTGAHIISLKQNVSLKQKDLKSIIYVFTDVKNKVTVIPGETILIGKNKILAKLSFQNSISSGLGTLAVLLNKGGGKKDLLAKGQIKLFDSLDFENFNGINLQSNKISALPMVTKIQGKVTGASKKGGNIIRLTFYGNGFGTKEIKVRNQRFLSEAFKTHTFLSFSEESDIEILRVRVLGKGNKMLVILRSRRDDIASIPFTISTPKGQDYSKKMGIDLFSKKPDRSIILELDNKKDKK